MSDLSDLSDATTASPSALLSVDTPRPRGVSFPFTRRFGARTQCGVRMNWKKALEKKKVVVSDGAFGTELMKRGLAAGQAAELWNAEHADAVAAVAKSYVEAGSDILLTNTFGGSRIKLERAGLAARTAELNRCGVAIARQAAGRKAAGFASIGPTGEFLEPLGTLSEAQAVACFAEQIAACVAGGAQGIVIESMADLAEAKAGLAAARQACQLPVVVSMTFAYGAKGFATMMGVTPERAAKELDAAGADIIGANCGAGVHEAVEIARLLRAATKKPLWLKPNAGLPELVDGRTVFRETPEQFAAEAPRLVAAGANIIGGCCGTTPEHIRAIVAAMRQP